MLARGRFVDDGDRPRPAGGTAPHLDGKRAHRESLGRQRLEIVQLLDVAIADLAAGLVAFPDQAGVMASEIFLPGMDEWRVPAPAVGTRDPPAPLGPIEGRP